MVDKSSPESADNYQGVLWPLSAEYRLAVCKHGIQWLVQKRYKTAMGYAWRSISYHRTKEALFFRIFSKSRPIPICSSVLALLNGLPDRIEN